MGIEDVSGKLLLDWLVCMSGCEYLSDLLYDRARRPAVHTALEKLTPDAMPLEAWRAAAEYLLGEPMDGKTAVELYAVLLQATS